VKKAVRRKVKEKVQLFLCLTEHYDIKAYGEWIIDVDARFLDLGSFTPWSLCSKGKSPWNPLGRRLGGPQNRSVWLEEQKILSPTGASNPAPQ
jgi:hypothetical protein